MMIGAHRAADRARLDEDARDFPALNPHVVGPLHLHALGTSEKRSARIANTEPHGERERRDDARA